MGKIISEGKVDLIVKKLKSQGRKLVLAGGCFDVLHPGHIIFLEKAKNAGDVLFVLLESDQKIKLLKGLSRPVHPQKERARVLSAINFVDYVVLLPFMERQSHYDDLVKKIMPDIIAATFASDDNNHRKRAADLSGAKLVFVTKMIGDHSTTKILTHNKVIC